MKVCTCFLLFEILAYTHSLTSNTPESNQRSVNLELETVLEFSNKDKEVDIKFLNNVQNFITKVKTVIDESNNGSNLRRNFKAPRVKTFTEFIQDVIHILNTYDDIAFKNFFDILDKEIRNYHYRGCRFYELMENYEIRKLIAAKLDSIKRKPTSVTKANINALSDMLKDYNYDRNVIEIMDYINSLYKQDAGENFHKVINDLKAYGRSKSKRSNNNLGKIIKNGVQSIIFNHYTNLNTNVRRDVKQRVETFWKQFKKKTQSTANIPNVKPYSRSRNIAKNTENIKNEVKPELFSRKDLMNIDIKIANKKKEVIKRLENNKYRNEIKQSEYKKAVMKRDDVTNEKKRYKHTRKDTINRYDHSQVEETRLSSQHTGPIIDQQRTKNEHQEQINIDSLIDVSYSSLEFYQEPQHYEKISQKLSTNVTQKPKKIEALNVTTRMPKNKTVKKIWIEESTRRLPIIVLNTLAVKPRGHKSRHNMTNESLNKHSHKHKKKYDKSQKKWHGKIYDPKYVKMHGKKDDKIHDKKRMTKHWSRNDTKYESRQKPKSKQDKKHKYGKNSESNDPFILVHNRDVFRQNYVRTTDSVFKIKSHQNKKSMGPSRVELKQYKRWSTASTKAQKFLEVLDVLMPSKSDKTIISRRARKTAAPRVNLNEIIRAKPTQQTSPPPPTNPSMRRLALTVPGTYSKRNKHLSWKPEWQFKKSVEQPSSSDEGMTVEASEIKDDKRRHEQNTKITYSSLEKDPYVIERIKNLEKELHEVKSRIYVNTDVVAARKVTHSFGANDDVVKRKQTENRLKLDVNNVDNDYKFSQDKLNMAGIADNKTKHIIENKYVKDEDTTINEIEYDIQRDKMSETKFKYDVNMIPNDLKDRTDKTKEAGKPDNKTDLEVKDFKNQEEIVDFKSEIEKVSKQQEIIKKDKKPEISLTDLGDVSSTAKDKGIKVMINDHIGDDASKNTGTLNRKIASLNTTKATKSITKTTTTVQPTVAVTTPTTLRLSTIFNQLLQVSTSLKLADVLQKADFNANVDNSKNRMNNNTSQVADVSKTTLQVTKEVTSELINKNMTNLQNDVTPMTLYD